MRPRGKISEFGLPPREYPILREDDRPPLEEGLAGEGTPPEEYPRACPEIVEPGMFPWQRGEGAKKTVLRMMFMAAALILLLLFSGLRPFSGSTQDKAAQPPPEVTEQAPEPEKTGPLPAVETPEPQPEPKPEPAPEPGSEPAPEPKPEPEPEPVMTVTPKCDIIVYGFSSEILGTIKFEDMDDVTAVRMEIWDPLTDSLERTEDITADALNYNSHVIEPFYTDFIYENHEDVYAATGEFPMQVEIKVVMQVGDTEVTQSQLSTSEQGWYVTYSSESSGYDYPGYIVLRTYDNREDIEFVVGAANLVEPGVMSISTSIDGAVLPESDYDIRTEVVEGYFADGTTADIYLKTILIRPPDGFPEGEGHVAHVDVTQYLNGYGMPWDTVIKVPLE